MIRDNGPGILFLPVKMMKDAKSGLALGECAPLNKAAVLHSNPNPNPHPDPDPQPNPNPDP